MEALIRKLAERNSATGVRLLYEILLLSLPVLILLRAAKNFFWDTFLAPAVLNAPTALLYGGDYWIAAAVFASLWAGLLAMLFTRRLRRGLTAEVTELAPRADRPPHPRRAVPAAGRRDRGRRRGRRPARQAAAGRRRRPGPSRHPAPKLAAAKS